jgi:hypothetical protein
MELFWRLQGTAEFEAHASWHGVAEVVVDEPADDWPGYVWAQLAEPHARGHWYLIRDVDVERAREGEFVDIFVPGLFGCDHPADLLGYIESQVGGVDEGDDLYVALYEGELVYHDAADDGVVFQPLKLVDVTLAHEWVRTMRAELGWE